MAISRQISSSNIRRQYGQQSPIYDRLPSSASMITNNTVSLPFTYYHHSPIGQSKANFDKISAWLHHTEKSIKSVEQDNHLAFIDATYQPAVSSTSNDTDDHGRKDFSLENSIISSSITENKMWSKRNASVQLDVKMDKKRREREKENTKRKEQLIYEKNSQIPFVICVLIEESWLKERQKLEVSSIVSIPSVFIALLNTYWKLFHLKFLLLSANSAFSFFFCFVVATQ